MSHEKELPEGWETKTLGEVCSIVNGGTPKSRVKEFWHGDVNWLTPKDMGKLKNRYVSSTPRKISATGLAKSSAKLVPEMSVIMSTRAPIGHLAINQTPMAFNQGCRGLVPGNLLDVHFLLYFLSANVETLNDLGTGTTFKELSATVLKSFNIPLPPLAEQRRIVGVLDLAFAAIGVAEANARKNLANARELFETTLNNIFTQKGEGWVEKKLGEATKFLGGGTPSKQKSEYWNGSIPWVSPKDMKFELISSSIDKITKLAVNNSATKLVPKGAVLIVVRSGILARTIPTAVAACELTINQDLKAICPPQNLSSQFVSYFMQFSEKHLLASVTRGATVHRLSTDVLKSLLIPLPPIEEQNRIADVCYDLSTQTQRLEAIYRQKLDDLAELKQSLLQKAFAGELAGIDTSAPEFSANVICFAFHQHVSARRQRTYGRVKAQKNLHLTESLGRIDLGRQPVKDAAGPNDSAHMRRAENWAREQRFFEFVKRPDGRGYDFIKLPRYGEMKAKALAMLAPYRDKLEKVTGLLINKDTEAAEILATVHAAWNNLIIDNVEPTDAAILHEARENWHRDKLNIDAAKFRDAIAEIRRRNIQPDGTAKYVGKAQEELL